MLCRRGADSIGDCSAIGRRGWPGHRAFRRTPVLRRAMPGHDAGAPDVAPHVSFKATARRTARTRNDNVTPSARKALQLYLRPSRFPGALLAERVLVDDDSRSVARIR